MLLSLLERNESEKHYVAICKIRLGELWLRKVTTKITRALDYLILSMRVSHPSKRRLLFASRHSVTSQKTQKLQQLCCKNLKYLHGQFLCETTGINFGVKRPERYVDHSRPSTAKGKISGAVFLLFPLWFFLGGGGMERNIFACIIFPLLNFIPLMKPTWAEIAQSV